MKNAKAAMDVVSFSEKMKHARKLVDEGHRLLNSAQHNLHAGRALIKQSRKLLLEANDKPAYRMAAR